MLRQLWVPKSTTLVRHFTMNQAKMKYVAKNKKAALQSAAFFCHQMAQPL
jgi:hypothetical protein